MSSTRCTGGCDDCTASRSAPAWNSRAVRRRDWRQDARDELEDLADLYEVDVSRVRLQ
ncbi:hypothetical protein ACFRMQ_06175 [Kitasatospora sp. NPDC056783]|uniref:hypothetical protein n=1 Tax=Kitasatospora sp. NPDC056783 TaxID=3345943 RepID=UPI0036B55AFE